MSKGAAPSTGGAIPPIIHRVWPGPDPVPYTFRAHAATFEHHNPGWEHRLWTVDDLDDLDMVNRDLYDRAKTEAPDDWLRWRADIARLEILYQYGGIYVDTDAECLKPLDPLLEYDCWFAESPNAPGHATQAVFGCAPQHPHVGRLLDLLEASAAENRGRRINHRVGSRFVDRNKGDVVVLPWRWFAGQSISDRDKGRIGKAGGFINHRYFNTDRHRNSAAQVAAFKAAADILNETGVEWFLTSGLLLGHIREGRILPWDLDVDIGIWPDGVERVREAFQGWQFKRDFDSQMWPVHNKTKIDIHTHYRDGDTVYKLHGKQQRIRMDYPAYLFDLQPSVFYLRDCLIPSPPEEYLAHMYGDDWLTPKKEWKWDESPRNITAR